MNDDLTWSQKRALILICIAIVLISVLAGMQIGEFMALNWCVEQAQYILEINDKKLDINSGLIAGALIQYKGHVERFLKSNGTEALSK